MTNINNLLKNAGFDNFFIDEISKENNISKYRILRNSSDTNSAFESLSEGEKNFIAFLYFYQQCLGYSENESSLKKIIVIDDPVSSMDSQVLFFVNSLIQELVAWKYNKKDEQLKNKTFRKEFANNTLCQVFIFTHNIYFYKEVSFDRRFFCKDNSFYIIKKTNSETSILYSEENPIKDDYTLLWNELRKNKNQQVENVSNILIANTMRRIIESYIYFINVEEDVWSVLNQFDEQSDDYFVIYSLLAEINDESHKVLPLNSLYYQRLSTISPNVLFKAFETIFKHIGEKHYKYMMKEMP